MIERGGVKIGIIGASTESTPHTTMPANFVGLQMTPAAPAIVREAKALRGKGANAIVVVAHLGSKCRDFSNPDDDSSCDHDEELYKVLADVPRGTVDVIVAGHIARRRRASHRCFAAVIESFSSARAVGRGDLTFDAQHALVHTTIMPPHKLCTADGEADRNPVSAAECAPSEYEGKPVVADPAVTAIVQDALARAAVRRAEPLGTAVATAVIKRNYEHESALGNLFTDLMLAAYPDSDAALTNGGGLRADLPAGPLTYGPFYEAMPFDNRFAILDMTGAQLRDLVTRNLRAKGGVFSWAGLTSRARCEHGKLAVSIKVRGKPLVDGKTYKIVTSDFLASGGDDLMRRVKLPPGAIHNTELMVRESMADQMRKRTGAAAKLDPGKLLDAAHRRIDFIGDRPLHCDHDDEDTVGRAVTAVNGLRPSNGARARP